MTGVEDVVVLLEEAGFARLPKPLTVAGAEFDFEAAARGTEHSHDLILVATDRVPRLRLRRLVAGLARSLDLAASRRPISLVLIGEVDAADRIELESCARVLHIGSTEPSASEIEEAIAVLLPLRLPEAELAHGSDPINEVMVALGLERTTRDHFALVNASADGPGAVKEALRLYANEGAGWSDEAESADD